MASAKHKNFQNFLFSVGGVVAMFLLLAGVYVLFTFISVRMDLTEEKAYTLSDGTRAILEKLDTPVTIRFYATQGEDMPVMLKTYAQRIEDLLKEYQKHSDGKIIVRKYDPEPLSDAEDSANLDGVEGQQIDMRTQIYLGISVSMLDSKETLPFLDPRRERLLEYDLTRAIANVMTTEKPLVGVMSSLPVFGQMNPMMMQMGGGSQPAWLIINELKRDYEVREVQTSATEIDPEIGILLVIHPKNLPDATLYALDQFVLRGGQPDGVRGSAVGGGCAERPGQQPAPGGNERDLEPGPVDESLGHRIRQQQGGGGPGLHGPDQPVGAPRNRPGSARAGFIGG